MLMQVTYFYKSIYVSKTETFSEKSDIALFFQISPMFRLIEGNWILISAFVFNMLLYIILIKFYIYIYIYIFQSHIDMQLEKGGRSIFTVFLNNCDYSLILYENSTSGGFLGDTVIAIWNLKYISELSLLFIPIH